MKLFDQVSHKQIMSYCFLINVEHLKLQYGSFVGQPPTFHISAEICGVGNFPIYFHWCMFVLLEEV